MKTTMTDDLRASVTKAMAETCPVTITPELLEKWAERVAARLADEMAVRPQTHARSANGRWPSPL